MTENEHVTEQSEQISEQSDIPEQPEPVDYLNLMEDEGILSGVNRDAELFKKMNYDRLVNNEVHKVELQQLDFVFEDPEKEQQKMEDLITHRMQGDRDQRYNEEFSHNQGVKTLTNSGHKHTISAVL